MTVGVRSRVVAIRHKNRCATPKQIANRVGVSRQRVSKILQTENLPTKAPKQKQSFVCLNCNKVFTPDLNRSHSKRYCRQCVNVVSTKIPVVCDQCGKLNLVRKSYLTRIQKATGKPSEHSFCNQKCRGRYSKTHINYHKARTYDYDKIWQIRLDTGYGGRNICKVLGLDRSRTGAVQRILAKLKEVKKLIPEEAQFTSV